MAKKRLADEIRGDEKHDVIDELFRNHDFDYLKTHFIETLDGMRNKRINLAPGETRFDDTISLFKEMLEESKDAIELRAVFRACAAFHSAISVKLGWSKRKN